jgi:hypothetical protein
MSHNHMVSGATITKVFPENLLHLNLLFNLCVRNLKHVVTLLRRRLSALSIQKLLQYIY